MRGKSREIIRVAGCMSGTSLDGVDIAVIETDGVAVFGFGETRYRAYSPAERDVLRAALGAWPGEPRAQAAAKVVEDAHIEALSALDGVAAIGFHGQTLAHDPDGGRTHQVGDGARLAITLGAQVIWDFRSADMAMGGQGAPLAPFYHWALARAAGVSGPVAVLNLGGVGNLTYVDASHPAPEAANACLAFDTGPANAPLDDFMRARGLGDFDDGGALAARGVPDGAVVAEAMRAPYFTRRPPKSLDRDAFAGLAEAVAALGDADGAATLCAVSVASVLRAMPHLPQTPGALWVTGGGRHNAAIMEGLRGALRLEVAPVETLGFDGDALEAQAFAFLAARVLAGLPISAPGTTGVAAPVGGARRSQP